MNKLNSYFVKKIDRRILIALVVLSGLFLTAGVAWAVGHDEICCSGPGSFHFELKDWQSPNDGADFNPGETITFRQKYNLEITGDLAAYVPKKNMRRTRYFRLIEGGTIYPLYSGVATLSDTSMTFISEKSVQVPLDIPLDRYKASTLRVYDHCNDNSQSNCPSNSWKETGRFAWWVNVDIVEEAEQLDCPSAVCGGWNDRQSEFPDWRFFNLCVNGCPGGDGYNFGDCWYDKAESCPNGCSGGQCQGAPPPPPPCDLCSAQEKKCYNDSKYQYCGDFNTDGCLEWSNPIACDSGETCSGGVCSGGTGPEKPAKPDGLQVTSNGCEGDKPKVDFKWNSSSGADYYTIDTADNNLTCPVAWKDVNGTSFTWSAASPINEMPLSELCGGTQDTTPQNNKNYWWKVNAINSAGHTSSGVKEFTTKQCVTESKGDFWTAIPRDSRVNVPAPFPYAIALTEGRGRLNNATSSPEMCPHPTEPACHGVCQVGRWVYDDVHDRSDYYNAAVGMLGSFPSYPASLLNQPTNVTFASLYFRMLTTAWYGNAEMFGTMYVPVNVEPGSSWNEAEVRAIAATFNCGVAETQAGCRAVGGHLIGYVSDSGNWYYADSAWRYYNKGCAPVDTTCPF